MVAIAHLTPAKAQLVALSLLFVGSTGISCSGEWVRVAATAPLDHIIVSPSGEAFAHAQPGVELQTLVSVKPFRDMGLQPGMNAEEAAKLLGQPHFVATERNGQDEIFGYDYSMGAFEIVKQHVASEGTEVDRWFLRHRPEECMELLAPALLAELRKLETFPEQVTVFAEPNQEGVAKVEFEGDHSCSRVWWLQEKRPPSPLHDSKP